jgi:hypothetical protein
MNELLLRRRIAVINSTPSLPYDAEVEYLESSGTQYIDTELLPTSDEWKLETKIKTDSTSGNYMLCGVTEVDSSNQVCRYALLWEYNADARVTKCIGPYRDEYTAIAKNLARNGIYTITSIMNDTKVRLELNGNLSTKNDSRNYVFTTKTLTLFARNSSTAVNAFYKGCVYYAKFYKNQVLVRDFIPVRVGTTGYMYDRVSGRLFGNLGTGGFGIGNDIT